MDNGKLIAQALRRVPRSRMPPTPESAHFAGSERFDICAPAMTSSAARRQTAVLSE
jgi:hypothetical protein